MSIQSLFVSLIIFASLNFTACQQDPCSSKNEFIESSDSFFEEFDNVSDDLKDIDIASYEKRYEDMIANCYKKFKPELSQKEKRNFWKSSLKFYIKKEGGILNVRFDDEDVDPVQNYISEEIEELVENSAEDISEMIESLLDEELPKLIDSFVGKVEELGENLKDSIDK